MTVPFRFQSRLRGQRLESRHLLAITIEPLPPLSIDEGTVATIQAAFDDSTPDVLYLAGIEWGDGARTDLPDVVAPKRSSSRLVARIDYQYDTLGFFDTAAKRTVMNAAARDVLSNFADELAPIISSNANRFDAIFSHPATGIDVQIPNMSIGQNEIVIFVGGRDLGGTTLAVGRNGTYAVNGTDEFRESVETRGQDQPSIIDFAPWGGHISFDMETNWHVGLGTDGLAIDETDLYTVAVHEMFHVLGFNDFLPTFSRFVSDGRFGGPNAIFEYDINSQPPLDVDLSHWSSQVRESGLIPMMAPSIDTGTRKSITSLDLAAMQDIGWELVGVSTGSVSAQHTYTDDGVYTGLVSILDTIDSRTALFSVNVRNVRPQFAAVADKSALSGETFSFQAGFSDPGLRDSHSATIDWGDGRSGHLAVNETERTVFSDHVYTSPGTFTVSMRISDDDGGVDTRSFRVNVRDAAAQTSIWQNVEFPLDVSGDRSVSPLDVLLIINEINRPEFSNAGRLPTEKLPTFLFLDVNGDGFVTSRDAVQIINELNDRNREAAARIDRRVAAAIDDIMTIDGLTDEVPSRSLGTNN